MKPSILWLAQGGRDLPSVRFRILPLLRMAEAKGWDAQAKRYPKTLLRRLQALAGLLLASHRADVLILQKRLLPAWELFILRRLFSRLVYDFDDAVWTDQEHPDQPRKVERFHRICSQADLVIAGTRWLAEASGRRDAMIWTSPIDTEIYTPDHRQPFRGTVGWIGTSSYLPGLQHPAESVARALGEPMLIVSNRQPKWLTPQNGRFRLWSASGELADLRSMDIGLMPLEDTPYTRGKGGFKLLQYMACGAVPVASNVGFNREIIRNGYNGLLLNTEEDWGEAVLSLRNDPQQCARLAENARRTVCEQFALKPAAQRFFEMMRSICSVKQ
ncbi:MAG: glycosyltransferase family 4 protein [Desulfovibrionaceae bacterium]|nr:glycosyltransferase family 4 protein [Desulfovibrionaceae bacterium]